MSIPPFAGSQYGNRLVQILENLVVKFGIGVVWLEVANQTYARDYVDSTTLYIPQVFRFFEDASSGFKMGFIVIEYVPGANLDTLDVLADLSIAKRTIDAIRHLATIPVPLGQGPGPVGGGPAYGYLWSDNGTGCALGTIKGIEDWMNMRLNIVKQPRIYFAHQQQLTIRHIDLARRNIRMLPDNRVCFMDWAFAGFYLISLKFTCSGSSFIQIKSGLINSLIFY